MTYQYWHTFDFPEFKTQGIDNSPEKLKVIQMPEDLKGKSVLDIGAWDGYFSFVAEDRGAKVVVAFDSLKHSWNRSEIEVAGEKIIQDGMEGIQTAKQALDSNVTIITGELDQIEAMSWDKFDLVLDLGILYHTENPFKHIQDLAKITKEMLILETHTDGNILGVPAMIFYPTNELNNDPGNWWGPNLQCVHDMLKVAGFKEVKLVNWNGIRAVFHAFK